MIKKGKTHHIQEKPPLKTRKSQAGQLELEAVESSPATGKSVILQMQRIQGNDYVQRLVAQSKERPALLRALQYPHSHSREASNIRHRIPPDIQRQDDVGSVVLGSLLTPSYGEKLETVTSGYGVLLRSPLFSAAGTVLLDATKAPDDAYELGFIQTLVQSTGVTGFYVDGDGNPYKQYRQFYSQIPVRDGLAGVRPWYGPEAVKPINAENGATTMRDQPQCILSWYTSDHKGKLASSMGTDIFSTWLALRHKASGSLQYLNCCVWTVDYSCTFDATSERVISVAEQMLYPTVEGKGLFEPLINDPVANEVKQSQWIGG